MFARRSPELKPGDKCPECGTPVTWHCDPRNLQCTWVRCRKCKHYGTRKSWTAPQTTEEGTDA